MTKKSAILLVNLGTPDPLTPKSIKRFLSEFLLDRHVVDINPLIWVPILHGIVIPKRLKYIQQNYQTIAINGRSPLILYCEQLLTKIRQIYPNHHIELAMTYGNPSLNSALENLKEYDRINVLPLYPQYSTTTTLPILNKIDKITKNWRYKKELHYIKDYADNPIYISALESRITSALKNNQPDVLLLSYHGIPIKYIEKRQEPYAKRCELTTQLLTQKLNKHYPNLQIKMAYQSRFGKGKWTTPNTSDLLVDLAKAKKTVAVICPGFSIDCIETLHEIDIENRELFLKSGGESFQYIPAFNDDNLQIEIIKNLIESNCN